MLPNGDTFVLVSAFGVHEVCDRAKKLWLDCKKTKLGQPDKRFKEARLWYRYERFIGSWAERQWNAGTLYD